MPRESGGGGDGAGGGAWGPTPRGAALIWTGPTLSQAALPLRLEATDSSGIWRILSAHPKPREHPHGRSGGELPSLVSAAAAAQFPQHPPPPPGPHRACPCPWQRERDTVWAARCLWYHCQL
ncbi:hypothetical protein I4F81_006334 [Pyropia yezoensis]|uniref:Uncharacterized protein n=1 Tax=Pyropia yezoensis TaxID=2788 RepID=A0ACC3C1A1_PYRYE|nr:hypothetical protein I4F81_006334 [Neopyropia yezoensis]